MKFIDNIKRLFKKEVMHLSGFGQEITSIDKHPRVHVDIREQERIKKNFKIYAGDYEQVKYLNSNGHEVKRDFFYINMMKEVARYMSSIVFNEKCEIYINRLSGDSGTNQLSKADEFIQHVFNHNKFKKNFSKYLEVMFATGGLSVRPYLDVNTGEIEFGWCLANTFIPTKHTSNGISEAVISSVTTIQEKQKTIYYTLLEFHEWNHNGTYTITNELYRSQDKTKLGKRVMLSELYDGLAEKSIFNGLSRPLFAYLKPFGFNNISPHSPMGLGLCDNAKRTLEQINNAYDSFYWELKMGKRKVIVTDHFLKARNERGEIQQYLDEETDVFLALASDIDDMKYNDITTNIRSAQYIESINKFMATLEMQVGLSTGTFTFDGNSVKTATEVVSENSATYRTRNSHVTEVEEFIKELIISVFELASNSVGKNGQKIYVGEIPETNDIGIDFDDGVFTDKTSQLEFLSKAKLSKFMPTKEAMKRLFDLPDDVAEQWIKQINKEDLEANPMYQQVKSEVSLLGDEE